jgi:hydroxymethylbilane synthase
LALWQAHFFQRQLSSIGVDSEIIIISTKGDRIQHLSFDKIEGKGFFTKEIEEALLSNKIDVAIHSHKDLETQSPEGLTIAAVSYREDPSESLLIRPESVDHSQLLPFKQGAVIGTSSARRKSQVLALRPDITIKDIRGNVPTRVNKLRDGEFDAILLASAGLRRLELDLVGLHALELDPRLFIPAPAQGVLAYQCRSNDLDTIEVVKQLNHPDVEVSTSIERGILRRFGGGCHIPIGVYAKQLDNAYSVWVSHGKDWNTIPRRTRFTASNAEQAIATFNQLIERPRPRRVFISRSLSADSYLRRACVEHGIELVDQPMIEIEALPCKTNVTYKWVIFSSSNGVDAFFASNDPSLWKAMRFAAAGEATARRIAHYGFTAELIGTEGDLSTLADQIKNCVGSDSVLLPSAKDSLGTLQRGLAPSQVTVLTAYQSIARPRQIPSCDAYIFTSPSNVEAFMLGNDIRRNAIAIGPSTAAALGSHGVAHVVAEVPTEQELFGLLTIAVE